MAHTPVNHPLRPVYRVAAALAGGYLLTFGVLGAVLTAGDGLFATDTGPVLGQGTNLAWSVVCVLAGAAVLAGVALGRNLDVAVETYLGWGLLVIGLAMLALIRTDANLFHFTIATVVVTFVVGLVLIAAGLYSKVAAPHGAVTPDRIRQRA